MDRRISSYLSFALVFAGTLGIRLYSANAQEPSSSKAVHESKVELAFDTAAKQGAPALRAFLLNFPKGGDLHVHLSGAIYAETFIRDAGDDGLCVDSTALRFVQPPCPDQTVPAAHLSGNMTAANQALFDKLIDAFSMRSFVPSSGWSGHDQFFATFGRFGGLKGSHLAEWVDEVAGRAAAQNNQYLELMVTPDYAHAKEIATEIGWSAALGQADPQAFAQLRQQLLDKGLRDEVEADRDGVSRAETERKQKEHCGAPQPAPACQVETRYLYQALRGNPPEQVFGQLLLGFETVQSSLAAKDDTWVGINLVQPEDGYISMRDYTLQMKIIGYLHSVYPAVPISLHAGELVFGLVPPEGLTFHIRQAVELAGAQRIGHGVDLMHEDRPYELLKELAQKHVMIEINLSSNEGILGVSGSDHPLPAYRTSKVPVALSTDDEGVSRIDLTNEYVRAVRDYKLTYKELKLMARTSMEHSFLPGASLWARPDEFTTPVSACLNQTLGSDNRTSACQAFLRENEKAAAQFELEHRFRAFEAEF
jgi:adenosine deaminase